MSTIRQRKLEQQRERQLSRQQQRRQQLINNTSSLQTENVEYINAYDNAAYDSPQNKSKKNSNNNSSSSKSSKSKKTNKSKEVSQLIDLLDDEDDFTIPANVNKPSKIINEENQHDSNDSTPTPYDQNKNKINQNEDLFNLSDASSESNFSMRDDVSIAGGAMGMVGVRPSTAQTERNSAPQENPSTTSFVSTN